MPFTLDEVVPWGRSFDEYVAMFHLTAEDLEKRILGCGDGPAGFNAVMRKLGNYEFQCGGNQMLRVTNVGRSSHDPNCV
jgi:hypothetical protein